MEIKEQPITIKTFPPLKRAFTEKYRVGLEIVAGISVSTRKKSYPEWTLTQVLADILKEANPDMPPSFVAEFVQHIITAFENYTIEKSDFVIV